jgi:hypothetical protein
VPPRRPWNYGSIPPNRRTRRRVPPLSGSFFIEFPGFQDPKNPFRDKRVREAVSLAIDRRGMNQAETAGMGKPTGNWINDDVQYAIEWPEFPRNVEKAKQLLREAGYPNGFAVDCITPLPTFYSRGERLIAQLREIGIRGRLQTMERGIFFQRLQGGLKEFPGTQIILHGARIGGSWSFWYEGHFKCGGFNSRDRICVKDLDAKFEQYERSINPAERKKLAEEVQRARHPGGGADLREREFVKLAEIAGARAAHVLTAAVGRDGRPGRWCWNKGAVEDRFTAKHRSSAPERSRRGASQHPGNTRAPTGTRVEGRLTTHGRQFMARYGASRGVAPGAGECACLAGAIAE